MPMALKQDVSLAQRVSGQSKPIDLVHLGHQTQGDSSLESEILGMFQTQAGVYLKMMNCSDVSTRIRAAHSLKGAARGIGAFELAELAEEVEHVRHNGYAKLQAELDRVVTYISTLKN
ncbi:MAG: Hpt domain-containing protein [Salaquimonas sp.]